MKKLTNDQMEGLHGGLCIIRPGNGVGPEMSGVECPGECMASFIVFLNTGHGLGGPDGFVCLA
jgi:hypothetical protein